MNRFEFSYALLCKILNAYKYNESEEKDYSHQIHNSEATIIFPSCTLEAKGNYVHKIIKLDKRYKINWSFIKLINGSSRMQSSHFSDSAGKVF